MHASINFYRYIPYGLGDGPHTVYYMELSQGQIIQKPNKQDLSSFFTTHRLNVMHAPVNFHKHIPSRHHDKNSAAINNRYQDFVQTFFCVD